jgi:DMSO reductase anchor subunit
MIYRSLVPIRQWSNRTTVPAYLGLALMTGAMWLYALVLAFGVGGRATLLVLGGAALLSIPATYMIKRAAWRTGTMPAGVSVQSATSLNGREVRSVEWPHTEENYLLKEMGYRIARKHAARLRLIATAAGFIIPLVLLALTLGHTNGWAVTAACAAALSMAVGVAVERWLFFAEAKHTVTLYYGR